MTPWLWEQTPSPEQTAALTVARAPSGDQTQQGDLLIHITQLK